jgi:hypothetical protein
LHEKHGDITKSIQDTNALGDEKAKALGAAIDEFNKTF